ncbi:unnamed protein product, partial [Ectocarpus sp. 6 AP-2014]
IGGGISTSFLKRYVLTRDNEMDFCEHFSRPQNRFAVCGRSLSLCALCAIILADTAQHMTTM